MDDIGLKQYPPGQLFVELLTPTSFLIFIILHLHYFQKTFLQLSDVNRFKYVVGHEKERERRGEGLQIWLVCFVLAMHSLILNKSVELLQIISKFSPAYLLLGPVFVFNM